MWRPSGPLYAAGVFAAVVLVLLVAFLTTTATNHFRLDEALLRHLAVTPSTTISRFGNHFVAALFHTNLVHIGFNLTLFATGYWLATRHTDPLRLVASTYGTGILTVFLLHLVLVLPLAHAGLPYALRALDHPLVGFSVIAYATLGMGLVGLDRTVQLASFGAVLLFEFGAALWFTAPFVSVYHVGGLGLGFYLRWLSAARIAS